MILMIYLNQWNRDLYIFLGYIKTIKKFIIYISVYLYYSEVYMYSISMVIAQIW